MKEYEINICLVDCELDVIHDALTLYIKTMPFKDALFASTILDKLYDEIEDAGVREV
jgi:hypothetical protein